MRIAKLPVIVLFGNANVGTCRLYVNRACRHPVQQMVREQCKREACARCTLGPMLLFAPPHRKLVLQLDKHQVGSTGLSCKTQHYDCRTLFKDRGLTGEIVTERKKTTIKNYLSHRSINGKLWTNLPSYHHHWWDGKFGGLTWFHFYLQHHNNC